MKKSEISSSLKPLKSLFPFFLLFKVCAHLQCVSFLYEYAPLCEGRHACLTEYLPFHILRCLSNAIFVPGGGCRCSIGLEIPSHSGDMFCFFCRFSFFWVICFCISFSLSRPPCIMLFITAYISFRVLLTQK